MNHHHHHYNHYYYYPVCSRQCSKTYTSTSPKYRSLPSLTQQQPLLTFQFFKFDQVSIISWLWVHPGLYLFSFFSTKIFTFSNYRLKQDSNSNSLCRRWARWPLDNGHGPIKILQFWYNLHFWHWKNVRNLNFGIGQTLQISTFKMMHHLGTLAGGQLIYN